MDMPERRCMICDKIFKPLRTYQFVCSNNKNSPGRGGSCGLAYFTMERDYTIQHGMATLLSDQNHKCAHCDRIDDLKVTMIDTRKPQLGAMLLCLFCRRNHYLKLTQLQSDTNTQTD